MELTSAFLRQPHPNLGVISSHTCHTIFLCCVTTLTIYNSCTLSFPA